MSYPELKRCIEIVKKLRHPQDGCPWDLKQTHETLLKYLIEESYEFIEATEKKDPRLMEEELGDVLFQVLLHGTIGEETHAFTLESAARVLGDKLIRRHPHVFSPDGKTLTPDQVVENWGKIKEQEKGALKKYSIDQKCLQAPALESAYKIGKKSTTVNFDWKNHLEVISKVEEEWQEVKEELPPTGNFNKDRVQEEIGDLLFSVAQLARHLDINPEDALRAANKKFINRFQKVEDLVAQDGKTLKGSSQAELEEYWVRVKRL